MKEATIQTIASPLDGRRARLLPPSSNDETRVGQTATILRTQLITTALDEQILDYVVQFDDGAVSGYGRERLELLD